MTGRLKQRLGVAKGTALRRTGSAYVFLQRRRRPTSYRPGVTVVIVNWNSLGFLRATVAATRAMSPTDTEIVVVDNASTDGSRDWLTRRDDVRTIKVPVNLGHGLALDLAVSTVETEFLAVLDVDAFPISPAWLDESIAVLRAGAKVAGAHMHRNFVHPCFLVTLTEVVREYDLWFKPEGSLATLDYAAPLFLDVGEALSQRMIVKFGGGRALHFFEITDSRNGTAGAVFGGLVYHNMFATQGSGQDDSPSWWREALERFHPGLVPCESQD